MIPVELAIKLSEGEFIELFKQKVPNISKRGLEQLDELLYQAEKRMEEANEPVSYERSYNYVTDQNKRGG